MRMRAQKRQEMVEITDKQKKEAYASLNKREGYFSAAFQLNKVVFDLDHY